MTSVNQGLSASEVAKAVRDCFPKDSRVDRVQKLLAERSLDCVVAVGANYANW